MLDNAKDFSTDTPPAYTPLVTTTNAPGGAASIASWMVVAAVAQLEYGGIGFGLTGETYSVAG
jgi:hypothetical protein